MSKLLFILSIFLVQQIYSICPTDVFITLPLSGTVISIHSFMYFAGEHYAMIGLMYIIYSEATVYRRSLFTCFVLMIIDFVDYCLRYNEAWFSINGYDISMNVFVFITFGLAIIYEHHE